MAGIDFKQLNPHINFNILISVMHSWIFLKSKQYPFRSHYMDYDL